MAVAIYLSIISYKKKYDIYEREMHQVYYNLVSF